MREWNDDSRAKRASTCSTPYSMIAAIPGMPELLLVNPVVPFPEIDQLVLDLCCSVLIEHLIYCSSETFRICIRTALIVV